MKTLQGVKNANILLFAESGFRVCILGHKEHENDTTDFGLPGKVPPYGFTKIPFNPKPDLKKFPHNYGIVLDADHLIIDVDPRNFKDGEDSLKKLCIDLMVDLKKLAKCKQRTGGGGLHLFFKKPRDLLTVNELKEYPGIEFKSRGRQVVGPGSIHPDTGKPYVLIEGSRPADIIEAPEDLLAMIQRQDVKLEKGLSEYDDSPGNMTLVAQALEQHPAAIQGEGGDNTTFQAAAICRDAGVSPAVALELLEVWNQRCEPEWDLRDLEKKVRNAYRYAQNAIGSKNPKTDFEAIEDEKAETTEKKPVIAEPEFIDDIEQNWCYAIGIKRFIKLSNLRAYDKEQFDDIHAGKTDRKKPSAYAIMHPGMKKVEVPTYWPGQDQYVEEHGDEKINLYRPNTLKAKKGDVAPFLEFVDFLVGKDKAWLIHDFFTYLLRNPGDKVLWAILLQGKPGVGKSLLARAMVKLFGRLNVSQPTNEQIHEKYTDWLKSCQLVVVHELMAGGRLEMMNKLKDPITEPTIKIREMFTPAYEITNRANLFLLTNHENSIILPDDDRRIAVVFSEAEKREPEYYDSIVKWMDDEIGALLHYYLKEHEYDARFKPKAPAPHTAEKTRMIHATRHPVESSLMDMMEDETPPMHGRLADVSQILERLRPQHKGLNYLTLGMHMKKCGFAPMGDRMRLSDGRRVRLWAIRNVKTLEKEPIEKIKELFEAQESDFEEKTNGDILKKDFRK